MDAPAGVPPPAPPLPAAWPPAVQSAVGLLLTAAAFFLLGRWSRETPPPPPGPVHAQEAARPRLDLNRAGSAELRLLPGVGPALAERIVAHRDATGPFRTVDDLRQVAGVGPKTLDRLRPALFVDIDIPDDPPSITEVAPAARTSAYPPAPAKASKKEAQLAAAVDVNRADAAALQKLPGIGPKLSQRIVDERTLRGPFRSADELRRVPGIGPKTLERLRPYVTVDPPRPQAAAAGYNE